MSVPSVLDGGRACFEVINGPAPGKFVETEHGTTHYVLEGPESGKLVVLQHGLGSHLGALDKIASDLIKKGYRVLRYDLYDRGYSETDPTRYPIAIISHPLDFTLETYVGQLRDVLTKLGLENQYLIHCGHSNGGVTGIGYTAAYPEYVKGLCLISAVCLPASKPLIARVADLPIMGSILTYMFGATTMINFATMSCNDPEGNSEVREIITRLARNTRENKRFFAAVRSTNGNCKGFVGSAEEEFRQCCKFNIPMHMIWGKADDSVPYSQCLTLKDIAKEEGMEVSETSFEGMPHNVYFADAKAEECSQAIINFVSNLE
jgi:pimeloyl-ACP methyl ester carboxylesterase